MRVLLAGGGTGGHVYPAIAIGQAFIDLFDAKVAYVGNENSFEYKAVNKLGWEFYKINIQGFKRSLSFGNLIFPFKLLCSLLTSRKIIVEFKPDVVVGTGGYASGPPLYIAGKIGIPTAIQEQNSFPGVTSRILSKNVDLIFLGFKEAAKFFPKKKSMYTGNPLRSTIKSANKTKSKSAFQLLDCTEVLLVFGGSQGSHSINQNFDRILPLLIERQDLGIIWQTGKSEYHNYNEKYSQYPNIKILPFIDNMAEAYGASDCAITRAGALTLAELATIGLPAILVPYPHATDNHQMHNARNIETEDAAMVVADNSDYSAQLLEKITELISNKNKREEMSARIRSFAAPDAAIIIANTLNALVKGHE